MFRLCPLLPRPARFAAHRVFPACDVLARAFSRTRNLRATPPLAGATPTAASASSTAASPRVLIYYAGKRTIYLATLKLYTVLLFSYTSLLVAPQLLQSDHSGFLENLHLPTDLPRWVLPTLFVVGATVPLGFISWLSPPYVTHLYLSPPPWARHSTSQLLRYVRTMPATAPVELATIRWFGRPKVTKVTLGELRAGRERWGCVNTVQKGGRGKWYVDWRGSPSKAQVPEGAVEVLGARVREAGGQVVAV